MKNLLLKQFIQGRTKSFLCNYVKYSGIKNQIVLDSIIPECFENLYNSTQAFIDGLVSLDEEFVASTSTTHLQAILIPQINKLKVAHAQIKKVQSENFKKKYSQSVTNKDQNAEDHANNVIKQKRFSVSPYVIFGETMEKRFKKANPWQNVYRVGSNRYMALPQVLTDIRDHHIYGFHCFYYDGSTGFQASQGPSNYKSEPLDFQVSFETNASNYEFFVSDFNNLVQKQ